MRDINTGSLFYDPFQENRKIVNSRSTCWFLRDYELFVDKNNESLEIDKIVNSGEKIAGEARTQAGLGMGRCTSLDLVPPCF